MHRPVGPHGRQQGVTIIAAIFLLVALSILGALMTVLLSSQSIQSATDLLSNQALYAAESGVQASAYRINQAGNCDAADRATPQQLEGGLDAWFTIDSNLDTIDGINVCEITVVGMAGGSSASPISRREFTVIYGTGMLNY